MEKSSRNYVGLTDIIQKIFIICKGFFGSGNIAQIGTASLEMYCIPGLTFPNADKAFSEALLSRS